MTIRIANLMTQVQRLTDRIVDIETTFGIGDDIARWGLLGLSPDQGRVMNVLMKSDVATVEQLTYALYGEHAESREHGPLTARVQVCHCRRKLAPLGVEIQTLPCHGRRLTPASKAVLQGLTER